MKCNQCGNEVEENVKFCAECGNVVQQPVEEKVPVVFESNVRNEQEQKDDSNKLMSNFKNKWKIILIAMAIIILIGVLLLVLIDKSQQEENKKANDKDTKEEEDDKDTKEEEEENETDDEDWIRIRDWSFKATKPTCDTKNSVCTVEEQKIFYPICGSLGDDDVDGADELFSTVLIPQINYRFETVTALNKTLYSNATKLISDVIKMDDGGCYDIAVPFFEYQYFERNGILSLVTESGFHCSECGWFDFEMKINNIDSDTGKLLTNSEFLSKNGYTISSFNEKYKIAYRTTLENMADGELTAKELDDEFKSGFENISEKSLIGYDEKGNLAVYTDKMLCPGCEGNAYHTVTVK